MGVVACLAYAGRSKKGADMGDVDLISTWSVKIAEEAAPDEVDLAPIMAQAYITGGKDREELLRRSGAGVQGAFGPEIAIALFPAILSAIGTVGPHLVNFLQSVTGSFQEGYYFAGALSSLTSLGDHFKRKKEAESLPDDRYAPLKQVSNALSEELSSAGVEQDQADLITYRVLKKMIEDPSGAKQFTEEVQKAP
jgi:hypothetical protein